MHNLDNDKAIDKLSKNAAEQYIAPISQDWNSMLQILDKELPEEKKKRRFFFWWFFFGGLLLVAAIYSWQKQSTTEPSIHNPIVNEASKNSDKTQQNSTINIHKTKEANTATYQKNEVEQKNKDVNKSTTYSKSIEKKSNISNSIKQQENIITSQESISINTGSKSLFNDQNIAKKRLKNSTKNKAILFNNQVYATSISNNKTIKSSIEKNNLINVDTVIKSSKITSDVHENSSSNTVSIVPTIINDSMNYVVHISTSKTSDLDSNNNKAIATDSSQLLTKKEDKTALSKWSVEGLFSTDISTVKLKYIRNLSFGGGMMIGYHINPKISIHTGAIFTQKNYKSAGSDFKAPKDSWISSIQLEDVTGYCQMWDFPILVRYNLTNSSTKNWFVSTGFSNYLMQKERYDYFYYNNIGVAYTRTGEYANSTFQPFSIVHISSGFQTKLYNSFFLKIEPYAKLPIKGVGFGNIALSSFGVNFSVQYRQLSKKK
ncbi:MAG: hypothetical protein ACOVNY_02210 [Chitinophagaceae bacterium]